MSDPPDGVNEGGGVGVGAGSDSSGGSDADVVAPGEGDDLEKGRRSFLDQAKMAASAQSTGIIREKWGSKYQFLMSCIASAVGLGNVWRFPAVCAKYGGASFFIPYLVVLFVIARPLFYLELSLGQFSSKGSVRCWDLSPMFTGVGYAGSISSILLSSFYIMLMAWAVIYACLSLISMIGGDVLWGENAGRFFEADILQAVAFNSDKNTDPMSYAPICHLVLALMISWLIIWGTMVGGVQASGKVAYVTALAPYVVLIALVAVGMCLEGNEMGLEYFIFPDMEKLLDLRTWYEAVGQCFFSLGIGFGGLIMFSSFNEFHHDIGKDVLLISIVDFVTSILAGVSLMTILGFQALRTFDKLGAEDYAELNELCKPVFHMSIPEMDRWTKAKPNSTEGPAVPHADFTELYESMKRCQLRRIVADGGAGIAFVQYPAAMYNINEEWGKHLGGFLSLIFFLMIILLAIGSANGFVGTTVTIISDRRPEWKRSNIVGGVCCMSFFIGLIYTNKLGAGWIDVVDHHGVTAVVYVLGFFEAVAIIYIYGLKNFCDDLEFMRNGKCIHIYFHICWMCLPVFMLVVYIAWLVIPAGSEKDSWTLPITVTAWVITACCILIIPVVGGFKFWQFRKNPWRKDVSTDFKSMIKEVWKPSRRWGPKDPEIRANWKVFKTERPTSYEIWTKYFQRRRVSAAAKSADSAEAASPPTEADSAMPQTEETTPLDSTDITVSSSGAPV